MAIGAQDVEIPVRITLSNDVQIDATVFPLASHRNDAPIDMLAGFVNRRRGEFFVVRMGDGSEMLLPLSHCIMFEIQRQTEEMMRAINQQTAPVDLTSDPSSVVSYASIMMTLETNRIVRGTLWFHDFEAEDERNVASGLNREARYVCVHGERSTLFVRRKSILKVQLLAEASYEGDVPKDRPLHVTERSGLVDVTSFSPLTPTELTGFVPATMTRHEEPLTIGMTEDAATAAVAPPDVGPTPAPLTGSRASFPYIPKNLVTEEEEKKETGPAGVDERFWY